MTLTLWLGTRQAEALFPGSGGGRRLLLTLSPWVAGATAWAALALVPRRRGAELLRVAAAATAVCLGLLTALYFAFVEHVGYGRDGATKAFVISWAMAPQCDCAGVAIGDCIAGLELDDAAVAECWGRMRVGLIRWLLAVAYLGTLVAVGGVAGLVLPASGRASLREPRPRDEQPATPRVFLSYRRTDSRTIAGRIHDRLTAAFGAVFKDLASIGFGVDFRERIAEALSESDVLLVVIGPTWLQPGDSGGVSRLEHPDDMVRNEIEMGLAIDLPIIPVLVGGARMPEAVDLPRALHPIVSLNAAPVRDDPDFDSDMDRLVKAIHNLASATSSEST